MIRIVVTGAAGRMGRRIVALVCADKDLKLVGAVETPGSAALGKDAGELAGCGPCGVKIGDSLEEALRGGDVVVDFSHPDATLPNLKTAARLQKAAVVGTTGHTPTQKAELEKTAKNLPVVFAPNMSVGVNVMWKILGEASQALGREFRPSVREVHHVHKKDKPSGTALRIVEVLSKTLGVAPEGIPVESVREGEVIGDHSTFFQGPGEVLEITHRAASRDAFAQGALRAAKWVVGRSPGFPGFPGFYDMQDVLGLR